MPLSWKPQRTDTAGWSVRLKGTLIMGAAYTLWMYKRVVFGEVANKKVKALTDMNDREKVVLGVLAVAVLWLGLWPQPLLEVMEPSVQNLLEHLRLRAL